MSKTQTNVVNDLVKDDDDYDWEKYKFQASKPQRIFKGLEQIQLTNAYRSKQIEDCYLQYVRINYKFPKANKSQDPQQKYFLVDVFNNNQYQNSKQQIPYTREKIHLDNGISCFTIGKLQNETLQKQLKDSNQKIDAQIIYNQIHLPDHSLGNIHLEVNFSLLNEIKSLEDHIKSIKQILNKQEIYLDHKTIEQIGQHSYPTTRKIKISDISRRAGNPTLIKISQSCENQVLQDSQTFKVGFYPSLIVKKIYVRLEDFFKKHSKGQGSNHNLIFDALQSLPTKVQFSGIPDTLAELFMLVQDRYINKAAFNERLADENLQIQSKLQTALSKNCILMNTNGDENQIEHFMLVADVKHIFSFGRMEYSDITFTSTQVSRSHGQIEFIQDSGKWIIKDGGSDVEKGWKYSTYGLWLEMKPQTYYFVDFNQQVKLGNYSVCFNSNQKLETELFDNQCEPQRQILQANDNQFIEEILQMKF